MCLGMERHRLDDEHDLLTSPLGSVALSTVSEAKKDLRTREGSAFERLTPWLPG